MSTDFKSAVRDLNVNAGTLAKGIPKVMAALQGLEKAAHEGQALEEKTKELVALAISIAIRCEGCIAYHMSSAIRHGASREEALEVIGVAVQMGGGPAVVYGGKAIAAFDHFASEGG